MNEPEGRFYRWSVKADRARAKAIDAAASRAGVSAEAFVQAHFDRILDPEPAQAEQPATAVQNTDTPTERAEELSIEIAARERSLHLGISRAMALVLIAIESRTDADGRSSVSHSTIARSTGLSINTVPVMVSYLLKRGLIENSSAGRRRIGIYRVTEAAR